MLSAEGEGRLRLAPVAETLITMDIMAAHPGAWSFIAVLHVFPETGQPKEPMDRQFLVQELNITERDSTSHSM